MMVVNVKAGVIDMTWHIPETAPSEKTVIILHENIKGRFTHEARRPKGARSWHNPKTGVEITQGRFFKGWLTLAEAKSEGCTIDR